ncbi:MAG TPA: LCP family protein [Actinomycetota bacterium]|nr:LCP family protein [Actinomycetota bacterium]
MIGGTAGPGTMMRKVLAAILALSAWIAGTVIGSVGGAPPAAGGPMFQVGRAHAEFEPVLDGKEPIFILVLGSDSRPGTPIDRGLADSIHILGIDPAKKRASLLGFPRDSYVPLSTGGTGKINAAMPQGGPQAMIATVEKLTGITIDYYALTGFGGLTRAVDQIGGLTIDLPTQLVGYDTTFPAGVQRLAGRDALQVARTRKSLVNGDFGRSENQGRLMTAALAQFRKEFAKDPNRMFVWLGAGLRSVETDLSIDELSRLAFTAMTVKPQGVTNVVAPGTIGTIGGTSIVNLSPSASQLYADLKADGYIGAGGRG